MPDLRNQLTTAVLSVDAEGAAARRTAKCRGRKVVLYPVDETMGRLQLDAPLEQLTRVGAVLDAAADQAKARKDPRYADEVRADTLSA